MRLGGRFWDGGAAVGVAEFVDGGSGAGCSVADDVGCEEELGGTWGVASHDLVGSGEEWSCVGVGWDILLETMSAGGFRAFPSPPCLPTGFGALCSLTGVLVGEQLVNRSLLAIGEA